MCLTCYRQSWRQNAHEQTGREDDCGTNLAETSAETVCWSLWVSESRLLNKTLNMMTVQDLPEFIITCQLSVPANWTPCRNSCTFCTAHLTWTCPQLKVSNLPALSHDSEKCGTCPCALGPICEPHLVSGNRSYTSAEQLQRSIWWMHVYINQSTLNKVMETTMMPALFPIYSSAHRLYRHVLLYCSVTLVELGQSSYQIWRCVWSSLKKYANICISVSYIFQIVFHFKDF